MGARRTLEGGMHASLQYTDLPPDQYATRPTSQPATVARRSAPKTSDCKFVLVMAAHRRRGSAVLPKCTATTSTSLGVVGRGVPARRGRGWEAARAAYSLAGQLCVLQLYVERRGSALQEQTPRLHSSAL